jgi:hypothetical protein
VKNGTLGFFLGCDHVSILNIFVVQWTRFLPIIYTSYMRLWLW